MSMILITDSNDVRQKFYTTRNLPTTYSVIDTSMDIRSMTSSNDFILRGHTLRIGLKNYIRECKYLYNLSFSINDQDLSQETIRVFINNTGRIYLGKIELDKELVDSILVYISFYIGHLTSSIRTYISSAIGKLGNLHNIVSIEDLKVDLVTKTVSIGYVSENKMINKSRGFNYISRSAAKVISDHSKCRDSSTNHIGKLIYAVAKASQTEYEEYFANQM